MAATPSRARARCSASTARKPSRNGCLKDASLRARLHHIPPLNPNHVPAKELRLRDCQETAITNLEESFKADRPRALIQMATGAGKTYTAITSIYRLLKYAHGKRILFLVDTKNLGEQAEQEMMSYVPLDDNRKFTELYNVQRLKSSFVAKDSQVCISTIQRLYSILKDTELDEATEEINPAEIKQAAKSRCRWSITKKSRRNFSTSSSSTNATAPSTTCGNRCSIISMPA